jgi:uncharacterized protein YjbI with pentapeptide repeats
MAKKQPFKHSKMLASIGELLQANPDFLATVIRSAAMKKVGDERARITGSLITVASFMGARSMLFLKPGNIIKTIWDIGPWGAYSSYSAFSKAMTTDEKERKEAIGGLIQDRDITTFLKKNEQIIASTIASALDAPSDSSHLEANEELTAKVITHITTFIDDLRKIYLKEEDLDKTSEVIVEMITSGADEDIVRTMDKLTEATLKLARVNPITIGAMVDIALLTHESKEHRDKLKPDVVKFLRRKKIIGLDVGKEAEDYRTATSKAEKVLIRNYSENRINGRDFSGLFFDKKSDKALLQGMKFEGFKFIDSKFVDTSFKDTDLSKCDFTYAAFEGNIDFSGATIDKETLTSMLPSLRTALANGYTVSFTNTYIYGELAGLDFPGLDLREARFIDDTQKEYDKQVSYEAEKTYRESGDTSQLEERKRANIRYVAHEFSIILNEEIPAASGMLYGDYDKEKAQLLALISQDFKKAFEEHEAFANGKLNYGGRSEAIKEFANFFVVKHKDEIKQFLDTHYYPGGNIDFGNFQKDYNKSLMHIQMKPSVKAYLDKQVGKANTTTKTKEETYSKVTRIFASKFPLSKYEVRVRKAMSNLCTTLSSMEVKYSDNFATILSEDILNYEEHEQLALIHVISKNPAVLEFIAESLKDGKTVKAEDIKQKKIFYNTEKLEAQKASSDIVYGFERLAKEFKKDPNYAPDAEKAFTSVDEISAFKNGLSIIKTPIMDHLTRNLIHEGKYKYKPQKAGKLLSSVIRSVLRSNGMKHFVRFLDPKENKIGKIINSLDAKTIREIFGPLLKPTKMGARNRANAKEIANGIIPVLDKMGYVFQWVKPELQAKRAADMLKIFAENKILRTSLLETDKTGNPKRIGGKVIPDEGAKKLLTCLVDDYINTTDEAGKFIVALTTVLDIAEEHNLINSLADLIYEQDQTKINDLIRTIAKDITPKEVDNLRAALKDVATVLAPNLGKAKKATPSTYGTYKKDRDILQAQLDARTLGEAIKINKAEFRYSSFTGVEDRDAYFDLSYVHGKKSVLEGIMFNYVDLSHSKYEDCDFNYSVLKKCKLYEIMIADTKCDHIEIHDSSMRSASMLNSDLSYAVFSKVDASKSDFAYSDLSKATFDRVNFSGSNFSDVDLRNTTIEDCNLSGANLRGAKLDGLTLKDVDLSGANLRGVDFSKVKFIGKINLDGAMMTEEDIKRLDDKGIAGPKTDKIQKVTPTQKPKKSFVQKLRGKASTHKKKASSYVKARKASFAKTEKENKVATPTIRGHS